jgi:hypothetical protein
MGGYFAYCLSTQLGIRTLLFNPAVHSRPIEPVVEIGDKPSNHLVILGRYDNVIKPEHSIDFFKSVYNSSIIMCDMGHVIPINIFKNYINLYKL